MIKKQVIDYILSNSGKLPDGETWYNDNQSNTGINF